MKIYKDSVDYSLYVESERKIKEEGKIKRYEERIPFDILLKFLVRLSIKLLNRFLRFLNRRFP